MVRVILERSSLGETGAASHSAVSFMGYCRSLTSGGTVQDDPPSIGLCLFICSMFSLFEGTTDGNL